MQYCIHLIRSWAFVPRPAYIYSTYYSKAMVKWSAGGIESHTTGPPLISGSHSSQRGWQKRERDPIAVFGPSSSPPLSISRGLFDLVTCCSPALLFSVLLCFSHILAVDTFVRTYTSSRGIFVVYSSLLIPANNHVPCAYTYYRIWDGEKLTYWACSC